MDEFTFGKHERKCTGADEVNILWHEHTAQQQDEKAANINQGNTQQQGVSKATVSPSVLMNQTRRRS